MIDWKTISDLHVINKLQEIVGNWFQMELFYTDAYGKIQSGLMSKSYVPRSSFFRSQAALTHGHQYLLGDIEKVIEQVGEHSKDTYRFDSFFHGLNGVASEVVVDGSVTGVVFAYPFLGENFSEKDEKILIEQLSESGMETDAARTAVKELKRLSEHDQDYLKELISLVAQEVMTFNEEIAKREQRIQNP